MQFPRPADTTSIRPPARGESMADSLKIFRKSLAIRIEARLYPGSAEQGRSRPRRAEDTIRLADRRFQRDSYVAVGHLYYRQESRGCQTLQRWRSRCSVAGKLRLILDTTDENFPPGKSVPIDTASSCGLPAAVAQTASANKKTTDIADCLALMLMRLLTLLGLLMVTRFLLLSRLSYSSKAPASGVWPL